MLVWLSATWLPALWSSVSWAAPPLPVDLADAPASATARGPDSAGKPHPVTARLLAESATVRPGGTLKLGIHLQQEEGWHTYWRAPGTIGQPTEAVWTVPAGHQVGPLRFPLPERFQQEGETSYGYDHEVLATAELTVPANAPAGDLPVSVAVHWLVCKSSCIPGDVVLTRTLRVDPGAPVPGPNAAAFAETAARMPVPSAFPVTSAVSVSAVRPEAPFQVAFVVTPPAGATIPAAATVDGVVGVWPAFVPVAGPDWAVTRSEVRSLPDGRVVFLLAAENWGPDPLPTADRAGALLQLEVGGKLVATEVEVPLPWAARDAVVVASTDPLFAEPEEVAAPPGAGAEPLAVAEAAVAAPPVDVGSASLWLNLVFAFVGGLILNVMPCVLPVLTLKIYGLVEEAEQTAASRRNSGLAYTGGVLSSFWVMAGAVVVLRSVFGIQVDWGSQFQYPEYVAPLAAVVFVFALSMLGVFELPVIGGEKAGEAASREGLVGVFFSGAFATLLSTPCSAPFLGGAVAYAFSAPTPMLFLIFTVVGLGLAAPFLGVALAPSLARFLPAPGPWMDVFKQLLGFSLVLTTVFLLNSLSVLIGPARTSWFLVFLTVLGMACWGFGRWGGLAESGVRQLQAAGAALLLTVGSGWAFVDLTVEPPASCATTVETDLEFGEHIPWQPFSEPAVEALAGKVVFIDFTAEWCLTCKVQERTVLETATVREAMAAHGVVPIKADWTRRDAVIKAWLNRHGRVGLPMYLVLPADRSRPPIVLPEAITPGMVVEALKKASS